MSEPSQTHPQDGIDAKKDAAAFGTETSSRSRRFSAFNRLISSLSLLDTPGRSPASTCAWIVPRQVVGRFSVVWNVGMVGSARPRCTSCGRFQAIASCGRMVLYSMR